MSDRLKKVLLVFLVMGLIAGYTGFIINAYSDYQESVRWAKEQNMTKNVESQAKMPPTQGATQPIPAANPGDSLYEKQFGEITGHDWVMIAADDKLGLVGGVLTAMHLTGTPVDYDEQELINRLDSFFEDESNRDNDIITAISYINADAGKKNSL